MKSEVFDLIGMTRSGYGASIDHVLMSLPGIAGLAVSFPGRQIEVWFDESKVTVDEMRLALQAAGHEVAVATFARAARDRCCS